MGTNIKESVMKFVAPPTLAASFVPIIVGFFCAYFIGGATFEPIHIFWWALALFGITMVETGKHALNELTDYHSGNDLLIDEEHKTPVAGGKKVLSTGLATEKQVMAIAVICFLIAMACGLIIVFCLSFTVLWYGIAGFILAISYNAEPFKLVYRGLGELEIFLAYGPVCFLGAYSMFTTANILVPALLSCSIGFLIANVLVINEFPDYEADLGAKKMNLIARVGKKKGLFWVGLIYYLHFVPIAIVAVLTKNPLWVISLITIIPMTKALKNAKANLNNIPALLPSNIAVIKTQQYVGAIIVIVVVTSYFLKLPLAI